MTAVFVHGVPDTYEVWNRLRAKLSRTDVIALALPGFGSPLPEGFRATKEEYVDWIIAQIERQPSSNCPRHDHKRTEAYASNHHRRLAPEISRHQKIA